MNFLRQSIVLRSLISLYLLLVFFVAVPFHQHADHLGHPDTCVVCAISHLPLLLNQGVHLIIALLVFSLFVISDVAVRDIHNEYIRLRSPPTF